jgi:phage terminase large subunit-like protein
MSLSLVQRTVRLVGAKAFWAGLTEQERRALPYDWKSWARPEQRIPEGNWRFLLVQAGRGFGKTRQGAEFVREMAKRYPGSHGALVAQTPAQARDVLVLGESGILACSPPDERPEYRRTERLLVWPLKPGHGVPTTAHLYSAHNFEELRGPQHHWAWMDELAKWKHPTEAFDQLNLGLRLGHHPRCIITTTPRPISIIRKLRKDPRCVVVHGSTFDNADNLAEDFLLDVRGRYEGTRLGRQELGGELLEDTPGALWRRRMIDDARVKAPPYAIGADGKVLQSKLGRPVPQLNAIVVGVDPSVADNTDLEEDEGETDLCGIVVAGRAGHGLKAHYYVLEDASVFASPDEWARASVAAYWRWEADLIVPEENQGGALVTLAIRQVDPRARVKGVHASRGKRTRAEPVSMLYEQKRVHHVGTFEELEDELCTWCPGMDSPDRLDALVWCLTELSATEDATVRSRMLVG